MYPKESPEFKASDLGKFLLKYHASLEKEREQWGRSHFPFHSEQTRFVLTVKASDGVGFFYFPRRKYKEASDPYPFLDLSSRCDLNTFCQSACIHRLRFPVPLVGQRIDPVPFLLSGDTELIPEGTFWTPQMFPDEIILQEHLGTEIFCGDFSGRSA